MKETICTIPINDIFMPKCGCPFCRMESMLEEQYQTLDINLRTKALQMICMLSLETRAIRNYLEECSNQMTELRKEKIEYQKARKAG